MSDRESWEVRDAALRLMQALVRRAGEGDENALADLAMVCEKSPMLLRDAVEAYRAWRPANAGSPSWTDVARVLGITRQGAHKRFTRGESVTPDEQARRESVVGRLEL